MATLQRCDNTETAGGGVSNNREITYVLPHTYANTLEVLTENLTRSSPTTATAAGRRYSDMAGGEVTGYAEASNTLTTLT